MIDGFEKGCYVKIDGGNKGIMGYCRKKRGGVGDKLKKYFVIEFDKGFR